MYHTSKIMSEKLEDELDLILEIYAEKFKTLPTLPFGWYPSTKEKIELFKKCIIDGKPYEMSEDDDEGIVS